MDATQIEYFLDKCVEEKKINRCNKIDEQLDIAEAFNFAYIGSQAPPAKGVKVTNVSNPNADGYKKWRAEKQNEKIKILNPDLFKLNSERTIWDNIKKSTRII